MLLTKATHKNIQGHVSAEISIYLSSSHLLLIIDNLASP